MVFSNIWKEKLTQTLTKTETLKNIIINVPASQINHAIGWKGENKKMLEEKFDEVIFKATESQCRRVAEFDFTITTKEEIPTIIADSRMPEEAKKNLKKLGNVLFLNPTETTYKSISAHPDIFFFQKDDTLIYAPNAPKRIVKELKKRKIKLIEGKKEVGKKYPGTVPYNAVGIGNTLIHNLKHTDPKILSSYENHINVNQGYTRCNLLALNENCFITSDVAICRDASTMSFIKQNENPFTEDIVDTSVQKFVLYIDPKQIKLEGHDHGFFPGCCGVWKNNLVVCGSTKHLKEKEELDKFLKENNFNIIELYDGELIDVGSVFFN